VTTIALKNGKKKLPTRRKNPLPPRHSLLKITVKGKAISNCYTVPDPNKPGELKKRDTRAYAILPPVAVGPIDKYTSKTKLAKGTTKAKPQQQPATPVANTKPKTTPPPCMPAQRDAPPTPLKKVATTTPKVSSPRKTKSPPKKASRSAKKKPGAPSRCLKKRAIVEVYRAVEYSNALAAAAAIASEQEIKELEELEKTNKAELKAKKKADNTLLKAIARSNPDYAADDRKGARQRMRDLRELRKKLQLEGKFDPSTIVRRPRRCKPCKDSLLPFVQEYQVTNLGVRIPISNTPVFFEAIQWYRRYIATDTEEEDNSKFEEHCKFLEGKIDPHHKDLKTLHPVDPAPNMEPGSEKCKEMIASIILGKQFLEKCIEKGLDPPRIDWVKHCRNDFQIVGTAVLSQGTE
jgi:hypothetical protein